MKTEQQKELLKKLNELVGNMPLIPELNKTHHDLLLWIHDVHCNKKTFDDISTFHEIEYILETYEECIDINTDAFKQLIEVERLVIDLHINLSWKIDKLTKALTVKMPELILLQIKDLEDLIMSLHNESFEYDEEDDDYINHPSFKKMEIIKNRLYDLYDIAKIKQDRRML